MRVDVERHVHALHLGAILRVRVHLFGGNFPCPDDVVIVVDVANEHIQRAYPLSKAGFQLAPFIAGDDARNHVEGNQALGARQIAVHGERDTNTPEQQIGFSALACDGFGALSGKPPGETCVVRPHGFLVTHFVVDLHLASFLIAA